MSRREFMHDAPILFLLLSLFALPLLLFNSSNGGLSSALLGWSWRTLRSLGWFATLFVGGIGLFVTMLVVERMHQRWTSKTSGGTTTKEEEEERFGRVGMNATEEEKRRAKRVNREERYQRTVEEVVRGFKGKGKKNRVESEEEVEMQDLNRRTTTAREGSGREGVRRRNLPPPPTPL